MKNIYLIIALMLLSLFSTAQTNVDLSTLHVHNGGVDTVYYCSTINFTYTTPNDTVGLSLPISTGIPKYLNLISYNPFNFFWTPVADTMNAYLYFGKNWNNAHNGDTSINTPQPPASPLDSVFTILCIKKVPASKICWVTVDSNFQHNVIIWDTTGFTEAGIDSVRIYYYVTINTKQLLKTCAKSMTYFVDSTNNPNSGTFKYLLAGVNACGNADTNSAWQTTAWIQQTGSTFTVASPYMVESDATPVSYYVLYRDTTGLGNDWDSIYETPGTVLNDPNYAHYPNAKYYVAAVLNIAACSTPAITHRMESMPSNKSKSNRLNNNLTGIPALSDESAFKVYPNPSNGRVNLYLQEESDVRIYNELGQEVFHGLLQRGNNIINIGGTEGLYILDVNGEYVKLNKVR